ncbi:hypothetical protein EYF80_050027 [Liparis tanakae]|uniref:Uncharacterized protein n=1 Tax=Liparis tanakae TaxID=230148 RepID=A0A4Z2FHM2_9TELE|nr:hypothetical protein EYF80_050027 [Liparis tanakae]
MFRGDAETRCGTLKAKGSGRVGRVGGREQSDVFGPWWEKHPVECDWERTMWDQQEGLPFLSKKASPPGAVGRNLYTPDSPSLFPVG